MRNIKVLPHNPMSDEVNKYNVMWGDGIYGKRGKFYIYLDEVSNIEYSYRY